MLWGCESDFISMCAWKIWTLGRQGSFQSIPRFLRISEDIHNPVWNGSKKQSYIMLFNWDIFQENPKSGMFASALKKNGGKTHPFPARSTTPPASTTRGTSRTPPTPRTPRTPPPSENAKAAGWWRFLMNFVSRQLTKKTTLKVQMMRYIYIYGQHMANLQMFHLGFQS